MKSVRIYKDDIRQHILRSLVFTDTVIIILGGLFIAGFLYAFLQYGVHFFELNMYIISLVVAEVIYLWAITHKIDNQSLYKIVPRAVVYRFSKKQLRTKDLEPYFTDFTIQDNHILRKNTLIKLFEVEPYDIALLNEQDREHFFARMKQMIHILPSQVQFIVRKEKMKTSDLSKHIFSLYAQSNSKREAMIDTYINDLSDLINSNTFMSMHYYAVFSLPCDFSSSAEKLKTMNQLNDMGMRFASAMAACDIPVQPLENEELISYMQSTLR